MAVIRKVEAEPITADVMLREFYFAKHDKFAMICPNVYVDLWAECDLLAITRADLAVEIEVKVTRDDYLRDFKKVVHRYSGTEYRPEGWNKHELLEAGDCIPNRFYFFTPEGLLDPEELPEYAGLFELVTAPNGRRRVVQRKAARRLHSRKAEPGFLYKTAKKFVYRYWQQRRAA